MKKCKDGTVMNIKQRGKNKEAQGETKKQTMLSAPVQI